LLGVVRLQQGRHAEALDKIEAALTLQPANVGALSNLAVVLGNLGRLSEALASCDKALAIRPDFADARRNRAAIIKQIDPLPGSGIGEGENRIPQEDACPEDAAGDHASVFDQIYRNNVWKMGSGFGSTEESTREYRWFLQNFLK